MPRKTNRTKLERELVKCGYTFNDGVLKAKVVEKNRKPPAKSAANPDPKPPFNEPKPKTEPVKKDEFPAAIITPDPENKEDKEFYRCGACQFILVGPVSPCPHCGSDLTWYF